jgi:hypothetical protein
MLSAAAEDIIGKSKEEIFPDDFQDCSAEENPGDNPLELGS